MNKRETDDRNGNARAEEAARSGNYLSMAAKKRVPPPQPTPNRTWHELTKAEQSAAYSAALQAYAKGNGPNPQTRGQYLRERAATATSTVGAN